MKAIVYREYGPPDVLKLEEIDKPVPGDNAVLLKVHAASLNPYDWHFMRGLPYPIRLMTGMGSPKFSGLGHDVAGEVEAVGQNVTKFKAGDAVFGGCAGALTGAFAEYACAAEAALAMKPATLTFEQAAAIPIAGLTALQGLRDKARVQAGQNVLVNGAAGGVGTFGVQIAKSFGADVTGVCSTRNVEMVHTIGAQQVIDYTQQDFTKMGKLYDVILDCIGNHSLSAYKRILNPKGILVSAGGVSGKWKFGLLRGLRAQVMSKLGSRKLVGMLARTNHEDLAILGELVATGKINPVIDRRYPLSEVPEAIRYLEEGHVRGKVVVTCA